MTMTKKRFIIFLLSTGIILSSFNGCIPLEGLGQYWDKGFLDPQLEGHWKSMDSQYGSDDSYTSFIKKGNLYEIRTVDIDRLPLENEAPDINKFCKNLSIGKSYFLMVNLDNNNITSQEEKGFLIRYEIKNDTLTFYNINMQKLYDAVQNNHVEGHVRKDEYSFPLILGELNEKIVNFIKSIENDESWWEKPKAYRRVSDIDKEIKKSLTYPATDKTPANTAIDINIPEFSKVKAETVLRMLEAMTDWKVVKRGDNITSFKRMHEVGIGNIIGVEELEYLTNSYGLSNYLFRFSKEPFGDYAYWTKRDYVMKLKPTAGKIQIKLKSSLQGIESYLAIGQEGLWFEFFEQTQKEPRVLTREAISWLSQFLKEVQVYQKEIDSNGFAKEMMPPDDIRKGSPSIEVKYDLFGCVLNAWVNPMERGQVYCKVFNASNDEPIQSPQTLFYNSREYTGFSSDSSNLFFYEFLIASEFFTKSNNEYRIELWFAPQNNNTHRKLLETKFVNKREEKTHN